MTVTEFTLDTSGGVGPMPGWYKPVPTSNRFIFWPALSPFTQGYVEALFASLDRDMLDRPVLPAGGTLHKVVGFSDLHPEALDMILRDCEAYRGGAFAHNGATFWGQRQEGQFPAFPPLRVYLDDAGKVQLEAQQ